VVDTASVVVVPNVHEYVCRGMDPGFPEVRLKRWRDIGAGYADAGFLWEGDNKLVIAPKPINDHWLEYLRRLLGYRALQVVVPRRYSSDFCMDIAMDEPALDEIAAFVHKCEIVRLLPWGATDGLYALLGEFSRRGLEVVCDELPERNNYWTSQYFDSKVGFRIECEKLFSVNPSLQVPKGFACASFREAMEVLRSFHFQHKPCVVKAASGVGGFGNVFVTGEWLLRSYDDVLTYVKANIKDLPYFGSSATVVEEFVTPEAATEGTPPGLPRSIFMSAVNSSCGETEIIGGGVDIRSRFGYYAGAELGRETALVPYQALIRDIMQCIGEHMARYGYCGHWGVNFVVSSGGIPKAIELNARRCGESHVYAMAKRLFGDDWMSECYILSRFPWSVEIMPGGCVDSILDAFEETNRFLKSSDVLAVPTEVSWLQSPAPAIGYALFGNNRTNVMLGEQHLQSRLVMHGIKGTDN
jgi:hypothetical protein